jgi:hypothetical protein
MKINNNNLEMNDKNIDKYIERFDFFQRILLKFADTIQVEKKEISISMQCLSDIIISVENEIKKTRAFHSINHVSWCREISLYCYYILKRKPILLSNNSGQSIFINERFCVALLLSNLKIDKQDSDQMSEYTEFLIYQFSYGELTKDSLYLLAKTLEMLKDRRGNEDV